MKLEDIMQSYRIEKDLLGEKEIPVEAYYGIHTQRAIDNFQISGKTIGENALFIRALAQVKKACALANEELGTISHDVARSIVGACDIILQAPARWSSQFPSDVFQGGAGTSVNMNAKPAPASASRSRSTRARWATCSAAPSRRTCRARCRRSST